MGPQDIYRFVSQQVYIVNSALDLLIDLVISPKPLLIF